MDATTMLSPLPVSAWTYSPDQTGKYRLMGFMSPSLAWQRWFTRLENSASPYYSWTANQPIVSLTLVNRQDERVQAGPFMARIDVSTTAQDLCAESDASVWSFWLLDATWADVAPLFKTPRQWSVIPTSTCAVCTNCSS